MNYLVADANSLYARSWFAAQRISTDPKEAIRLAVNTIILLLNPDTNKIGINFDGTLFAWDSHQNKSKHRDEKPPEYHETKEVLKEVLTFLFGTIHVEHPDVEGDDIVATAVYKNRKQHKIYVVSGDKDLMQLQGENCEYYSLHEKAVLSPAFIISKFQSIKRPDQVSVALAITGDPVDNIGGIVGFGPVRCKKLFENVTATMSLSEVADAVAAQLTDDQRDQFYASLERTLLKPDVPGIPKPAPLSLADPSEVDKLGVQQIGFYYRQLHRIYADSGY